MEDEQNVEVDYTLKVDDADENVDDVENVEVENVNTEATFSVDVTQENNDDVDEDDDEDENGNQTESKVDNEQVECTVEVDVDALDDSVDDTDAKVAEEEDTQPEAEISQEPEETEEPELAEDSRAESDIDETHISQTNGHFEVEAEPDAVEAEEVAEEEVPEVQHIPAHIPDEEESTTALDYEEDTEKERKETAGISHVKVGDMKQRFDQKGAERNYSKVKSSVSKFESPAKKEKGMFKVVQTEKCDACQKTVYAMEKLEMNNHVYHKNCFKCSHCSARLTPKTFSMNEGVIYCVNHFKQLFARKGNYDEGFGRQQYKKKWQGGQDPSKEVATA